MALNTNLVSLAETSLLPVITQFMTGNGSATEAQTQSATKAAIPAILGGLLQQSSQTSGAQKLIHSFIGNEFDANIGNNLSYTLRDTQSKNALLEEGKTVLTNLFGNKLNDVVGHISETSGASLTSTSSILQIAAPAVMGMLKKNVMDNNLNAAGLQTLLSSQSSYLSSGIGEKLMGLLGWGGLLGGIGKVAGAGVAAVSSGAAAVADAGAKVGAAGVAAVGAGVAAVGSGAAAVADTGAKVGAAGVAAVGAGAAALAGAGSKVGAAAGAVGSTVANAGEETGSLIKKWWWLIPLILLALWALKSCNGGAAKKVEEVAAKSEAVVASAVTSVASTASAVVARATDEKSAEAANMSAKEIFAKLAASKNCNADELVKALNMTVINFKSGSAEIPAVDQALLDQAAPAVTNCVTNGTKLAITGYTDNVGQAASNQKLSESRAKAVAKQFAAKGVAADALTVSGKGADDPVGDNATPEGRFQNRRIAFAFNK